jgi:hypothetical protein
MCICSILWVRDGYSRNLIRQELTIAVHICSILCMREALGQRHSGKAVDF